MELKLIKKLNFMPHLTFFAVLRFQWISFNYQF
jgi:hypothetical protein